MPEHSPAHPRSTFALIDLVMERPLPLQPPPQLGRLRTEQPVAKVHCPRDIEAWLITRYDDVRAVLADTSTFSSIDAPFGHLTDSWDLGCPPDPGSLIRMDGAEHARLRRRLAGEFTVRRMHAWRPHIQRIVDTQIDVLATTTLPADLYSTFALPVSSLIICELLGIPHADCASFYELAAQINDLTATPQQRRDADATVHTYLAGRVRAELDIPRENVIGRLIRDNDPDDPLTSEELTTLASTLLVAGQETTANMIALALVALLQRPIYLKQCPDLSDQAIEELLRHLAIVHYGTLRCATQDTTIAGQPIRTGDYVVVSIPAANHDPELLSRPEQLDLHRRHRLRHLAFGHGPHQCLGQHLARTELQVALSRIFRRIPTLQLSATADTLTYQTGMTVYGVHPLPAMWEAVLPRATE